MTDWVRASSGQYFHVDTSRLRTMMQDWVEDQPSGGAAYRNFWTHPYATRLPVAGPNESFQSKFVRKLSRAALSIRILQRKFRNRHWRRVQRYIVARGISLFGSPERGLLKYTWEQPKGYLGAQS